VKQSSETKPKKLTTKSKTTPAAAAAGGSSKQQRLSSVYIILSCEYPFERRNWGEYEHETEDTMVIGVFANLKYANKCAKIEAYDGDEEEDDGDDDDNELFLWDEDESDGWKAKRVWVEKETIQY
jgi:hypothetical protein